MKKFQQIKGETNTEKWYSIFHCISFCQACDVSNIGNDAWVHGHPVMPMILHYQTLKILHASVKYHVCDARV